MQKDLPELALINRLKDGDPKAFQHLFDKYWDELFPIALKKTGDENLAKDLVQEVFINFYSYRKSIQIRKSLSAYLRTMLKYQFLKQVRTAASAMEFEKEFIEINKDNLQAPFFSITEFNELYNVIEEAIDGLPSRCKEIFKMNRFEGRSIEEISQDLDIAESTVRNQLAKATQTLHFKLKTYVGLHLLLMALLNL